MKPSTAAKVASVAVAMSMLTSEAATAGKPAPPASKPVKYRILQVLPPNGWTVTNLAINDGLTIIGDGWPLASQTKDRRPLILSVSPDDVDPVVAERLDGLVASPLPEGMAYLSTAWCINNAGLVVGQYRRADDTNGGLYVVDTSAGPPFPVQRLPLLGDPPVLRDMNENGDVLYVCGTRFAVALRAADGAYQSVLLPEAMTGADGSKGAGINDATAEHSLQVVGNLNTGKGVVYELDPVSLAFVQVCVFTSKNALDINDAGIVTHQLLTKQETSAASYFVRTGLSTVVWDTRNIVDWPNAVNGQGQIGGMYGLDPRRGFIYDPTANKSWALDDLVYGSHPEDITLWFANPYRETWDLTGPDLITGFPAIMAGRGERGYVLFPELPNAP